MSDSDRSAHHTANTEKTRSLAAAIIAALTAAGADLEKIMEGWWKMVCKCASCKDEHNLAYKRGPHKVLTGNGRGQKRRPAVWLDVKATERKLAAGEVRSLGDLVFVCQPCSFEVTKTKRETKVGELVLCHEAKDTDEAWKHAETLAIQPCVVAYYVIQEMAEQVKVANGDDIATAVMDRRDEVVWCSMDCGHKAPLGSMKALTLIRDDSGTYPTLDELVKRGMDIATRERSDRETYGEKYDVEVEKGRLAACLWVLGRVLIKPDAFLVAEDLSALMRELSLLDEDDESAYSVSDLVEIVLQKTSGDTSVDVLSACAKLLYEKAPENRAPLPCFVCPKCALAVVEEISGVQYWAHEFTYVDREGAEKIGRRPTFESALSAIRRQSSSGVRKEQENTAKRKRGGAKLGFIMERAMARGLVPNFDDSDSSEPEESDADTRPDAPQGKKGNRAQRRAAQAAAKAAREAAEA